MKQAIAPLTGSRLGFEPEQLPKSGMHAPVASLPLLPRAHG